MTEATADIKRRLRRSKDSERRMGRWLLKHDGPDPRFRPGGGLVTTTGRVGHVTGLQFDTLSATYAGENKQQQVWAGLWGFWKKIVEKAKEQHKEPLLRIEPTNDDAARYPILHIITEDRHAELLRCEKELAAIHASPDVTVTPLRDGQLPPGLKRVPPLGYSKEQQVGRRSKPRRGVG